MAMIPTRPHGLVAALHASLDVWQREASQILLDSARAEAPRSPQESGHSGQFAERLFPLIFYGPGQREIAIHSGDETAGSPSAALVRETYDIHAVNAPYLLFQTFTGIGGWHRVTDIHHIGNKEWAQKAGDLAMGEIIAVLDKTVVKSLQEALSK